MYFIISCIFLKKKNVIFYNITRQTEDEFVNYIFESKGTVAINNTLVKMTVAVTDNLKYIANKLSIFALLFNII